MKRHETGTGRFGIRIRLEDGSTLAMSHLLGDNFEAYRWFSTEQARDQALVEMQRHLPNYRDSDRVRERYERVERDHG
ncbi:MAG: hypothetical protein ACK4IT_02565 [Thioalkalivibrionaceae bacterium]